MGLALDEQDDKRETFQIGEICVQVDERVKKYIFNGPPVRIDYIDGPQGKGFIIDTGSSCC